MSKAFELGSNNAAIPLLVENEAFEGVKRVAQKVARDIEKVCGTIPAVVESISGEMKQPGYAVLFATLGKSVLTDSLIKEGKFDPSKISGKREVYQIQLIENPFPEVSQLLLICGSDKRGTIYGMFSLSEYIGVSPLCYWGDVEPVRRSSIEITADIETISKEPSVKYRGFFINDEWPCYGNWTFSHFGGFTAEMYDNVFELLLRLKGNYLWPAMWTSSFPLDGPGSLNEELADIYGVVIGASHHEPCLRASEEWDKVRGPESAYGNEWNYYTNRDGLLKYWEDALIRSGKTEHIITIGMRGERDSSMLGPDATLADNINLLKDIITNQRELIKKHVNPNIEEVPQLLALYKEVEEYFYGNEEVAGLKDWGQIEDVIYMLCEDNYGFMRTLPSDEIRNHRGGFGMYYHFDYHGGPISYEWVTSTPFTKVWEQMSMAYDYGIRDVWIVNVGDLKFNEVPLAYFMELAYDFEKWGTSAPNSQDEYTEMWLGKTFPSVDRSILDKMACVIKDYIKLNSMRRPEALNQDIYHPSHYSEADRMLCFAEEIEKVNDEVYESLSGNDKDAYYSMVYFPAKASVNLLRMHLYAGKNAYYAKQGKPVANKFADLVTECIELDRVLASEMGAFKDGKWKGMELEQHIGFVTWNDDGCRYPLRVQVEPVNRTSLAVSRKDSERLYTRTYGHWMTLEVEDFLYEGNTEVVLEIANTGTGSFDYTISIDENSGECGWLSITPMNGTVALQEEVVLRCDRDKLPENEQTVRILIKTKGTTVAVVIKGKAVNKQELTSMTFLENDGIFVMEANHYSDKHDTPEGGFVELRDYGRSGCGMKVFPTTVDFNEQDDKPSLTYRFKAEVSGSYVAEIWMTPTNSVQNKRPMRFLLTSPGGKAQVVEAISSDFNAGSPRDVKWCDGVLRQIRVCAVPLELDEGINEITVGAMEAGLVLERVVVYLSGKAPKTSYLGPQESFYVK